MIGYLTTVGVWLAQTTPACSTGEWANGSWHSCTFGPARRALGGEPLLALLIGGIAVTGMYVAGDGDLAAPSVLVMLFAGLLSQALPAGMVPIAWAVAFLGMVGAILAVAQRYVMNPGAR